jgi:hypothetical protein
MNIPNSTHLNIEHASVLDFNGFMEVSSVTHNNNLNILQINACSIKSSKKMEQVRLFIAMMDVGLDIIIIGETWLDDITSPLFNIPGYKAEYESRYNRTGGGLAIFIKKIIVTLG